MLEFLGDVWDFLTGDAIAQWSLLLYIIILISIWVIPIAMDLPTFSVKDRIFVSVAIAPITYFILKAISEK